jgi:hypothetical protein
MDVNIADLFTIYGIPGILVVVLLFVLRTVIGNATSWVLDRTFRDPIKEPDSADGLSDHIFFNDTNYIMRFIIPELGLVADKPVLSTMYRDLIAMTVDEFYTRCEILINTDEVGGGEGQVWGTCVNHIINDALDRIEHQADNAGVPRQLIRRYMKWVIGYADMLKEDANIMASSLMYRTNLTRTYTVLFIFGVVITAMVGDLYKLAHSSHTDVDASTYRGSDIEVW